MKQEIKRALRDFTGALVAGVHAFLLTALVLIVIAMFGFAVLFTDAEAANLINLLWGN
ncbi:MAG TPA: hypothetical protein VIL74_08800 [Pyrinomonadaceae bacterium]|jgi:hypothetical protein